MFLDLFPLSAWEYHVLHHAAGRGAPMVLANPIPSPEVCLTGRSVGRFQVGDLLGAGGMGEVYRAEDTALKRTVALKRVSARYRREPRARKRILREAERASALNSAHIAAIYDVLEHNDEVLLVMEYVEGTTLRKRIEARPMDAPEFLGIAVQCAEALAAAHKKNVVHGDIKPENIMLTADNGAKVLDFGLARQLLTEETAPAVSTDSTVLAGTPGYIAPEMLLGKAADARADIFALGVVFYEALARHHPFAGRTFTAAVDRTLHGTPQPLRELVDGIPSELERIISKMLAKDPADRYATSADLLVDLRALQRGAEVPTPRRRWYAPLLRVASLLLIILVVAAIVPDLRRVVHRWTYGPDLPEHKTLVVLPFVSDTKDAAAEAFANGLTSIARAKLTALGDRYPLQVASFTDTRRVSNIDQARQEVGATLVLEGNAYWSANRIQVTYSLVDARTHQQLRPGVVVKDASDPFAVANSVVDSLLLALELELSPSDREHLAARGTANKEAAGAFVRGWGYLDEYQNADNVDKAITEFTRALQADPQFAEAKAALGESYLQKQAVSKDPQLLIRAEAVCEQAAAMDASPHCLGMVYNRRGRYEDAVREFEKALEISKTNDETYRELATAYEALGRRTDAEETYRRAIAVRPNYWAGYNWFGVFLSAQGRYAEAAEMFHKVIDLAPENYRGYDNLAVAYLQMGRFPEAADACDRSLRLRDNVSGHNIKGAVYFYQGRYGDAAQEYSRALALDSSSRIAWANLAEAYYWTPGERARSVDAYRRAIALAEADLRVNPRSAGSLIYLGLYHVMLGEAGKARDYRARALQIDSGDSDVLFNAAIIASRLGETERALSWLQAALKAGFPVGFARTAPYFSGLKSDKRFHAVLEKASTPG